MGFWSRGTGYRPQQGNYALPGADQRGQRLEGNAQGAYGQDGRQAGSDFRGAQSSVLDYLNGQMRGQNSLSREQLRRDTDRNISQQQAIAAGARPGNAAMASRIAAQNAGLAQSGMAGDAAMAGIAERNAAANSYANVAGQARGQDINQTQVNDSYNQGNEQMGLQQAGLQQGGNMAYEGAQSHLNDLSMGQPSGLEKAIGLGSGIAKTAALFSDERLKTDIHGGDQQADRLASSLKPRSFSYRDRNMGAGKQFGIMAQDAEKGGEMGQSIVQDTPQGKVIDTGKASTAALAMIGRLAERLKKLEGGGMKGQEAKGGHRLILPGELSKQAISEKAAK